MHTTPSNQQDGWSGWPLNAGLGAILRRKNKKIPAPSRWSGRSRVGQKKNEEKLARDALGAVKQFHVLGSASLAGFEVIIEAARSVSIGWQVFLPLFFGL